jgi:DNA-binding NarL/FixJ family response regulator
MAQKRIAVVAGHAVIRAVVRLASESIHGLIVGEVGTAVRGRELLDTMSFDVLVLDLDLPDADGMTVLRAMTPLPTARILVLSDRVDGATVLEALRLGADGFIAKSDGLRGLPAAIRAVADGRAVVPASVEATALGHLRQFARRAHESARIESRLTVREREVLQGISEGGTTQQISRRMGLSPRTVETHIGKLYRKLGARTRVQALSRAAALGFVDF